jgi:hypothetical protein
VKRYLAAVAVGAILLVAAVVGFVVLPEHKPGSMIVARSGPTLALTCASNSGGIPADCVQVATGLSRTLYDVLRVTTWACLIVGALVVVIGLIGYARARPMSR